MSFNKTNEVAPDRILVVRVRIDPNHQKHWFAREGAGTCQIPVHRGCVSEAEAAASNRPRPLLSSSVFARLKPVQEDMDVAAPNGVSP
jgi:hypothetical protein